MKTMFNNILVLTLAGSLCLFAPVSRADVDVSVGVQINAVADFHAPLAHHGAWIEVGSYGRCWRPARVTVGWRPYCDGHWEWTDCGWYWVSDEPWAWATYHYGSWHFDSFHGWVWIPGVEWAPAWVYWRHGGGHIGWAPCGPRGVVVAPSAYVFVGVGRFHERVRPSTVIVNNTTIINKTTQITEIKRETRNIGGRSQRVVVNEGPGVEVVQKATRKQFAAVPVQEVDRRTVVPAEVKRRGNEPRDGGKSPAAREQPQPKKGREPQPGANPPVDKGSPRPDKASPPPNKSGPLDKGRSLSRDDVGPSPDRPPKYQPPPNESSESSKAKKGKPSKRKKYKSPKHNHP
jgi:hypothetical protein